MVVPTIVFPRYSCTVKYAFHGSSPDAPNYLSSISMQKLITKRNN
jgi:hypothetical protein